MRRHTKELDDDLRVSNCENSKRRPSFKIKKDPNYIFISPQILLSGA
jgi:hypothetical protein